MGEIRVDVELCGTKKCVVLRSVLVDTGATIMTIPESVGEEIGYGVSTEETVTTMDGRRIRAKMIASIAKVNGRRRVVPVALVEDEKLTEPVIGVMTLEALGLKVDPLKRTLEEGPPLRL